MKVYVDDQRKEAFSVDWEKIKDAPDVVFSGQDLLLYNECWGDTFGEYQIGFWKDDHWQLQSEMNLENVEDIYQPTHYMTLPAPPPEDDD